MNEKKTPRKVGRPSSKDKNDNDARKNILNAARELFVNLPYSKVSITKISNLAKTNPALVRYYFINKENLYQQILISISNELKVYLMESNWKEAKTPVRPILSAYMKLFKTKPSVTKLVFREILSANSSEKKKVIDYLFKRNSEMLLKFMEPFGVGGDRFKNLQLLINFASGMIFTYAFKCSLEDSGIDDFFFEDFEGMIEESIYLAELAYLKNNK
ncbi:TetR/AcrR family transcriptional regulator [Marinomonas sp. S3726]|uniref:TetR/AcrR family transcriptional regulator n=1 Tax=Marinomonas sp. S3726 TaxID=579484 RepID=UPI000697EBA1|nr:TetR/AcrR family transcriptional regulator [Marinomonas sp. S3726]